MAGSWRRDAYLALWVFALAFGFVEAASVVYLRATTAETMGAGVQFPLTVVSSHLVSVEIIREACTMLMIGAIAWAVGRRRRDAIGAFLFVFGIWDLAYYAALRLAIGWPNGLSTWDVLFLIPLPWVAPIWAPASVAVVFAAAGSYLFWTSSRPHRYITGDFVVLAGAALVIVAAFLVDWAVIYTFEPPPVFPRRLFLTGMAIGVSWFIHAERRTLSHA